MYCTCFSFYISFVIFLIFAGEPAHENPVPAPPAQPEAPYQPAGQAPGPGGAGEAENSGGKLNIV